MNSFNAWIESISKLSPVPVKWTKGELEELELARDAGVLDAVGQGGDEVTWRCRERLLSDVVGSLVVTTEWIRGSQVLHQEWIAKERKHIAWLLSPEAMEPYPNHEFRETLRQRAEFSLKKYLTEEKWYGKLHAKLSHLRDGYLPTGDET
jgi:hypothetical protein